MCVKVQLNLYCAEQFPLKCVGLLVLNYAYTNEGLKEFFQIYFDFPQN